MSNNKNKVLESQILGELEGNVKDVIKFLQTLPENAYLEHYWEWEDLYIQVVLKETPEQKEARLAKEKAEKEAKELERKIQQFKKLQKELEGKV